MQKRPWNNSQHAIEVKKIGVIVFLQQSFEIC